MESCSPPRVDKKQQTCFNDSCKIASMFYTLSYGVFLIFFFPFPFLCCSCAAFSANTHNADEHRSHYRSLEIPIALFLHHLFVGVPAPLPTPSPLVFPSLVLMNICCLVMWITSYSRFWTFGSVVISGDFYDATFGPLICHGLRWCDAAAAAAAAEKLMLDWIEIGCEDLVQWNNTYGFYTLSWKIISEVTMPLIKLSIQFFHEEHIVKGNLWLFLDEV